MTRLTLTAKHGFIGIQKMIFKKLNLKSDQCVFLFLGETLLKPGRLLSLSDKKLKDVYLCSKELDGLLYLNYSLIPTFG